MITEMLSGSDQDLHRQLEAHAALIVPQMQHHTWVYRSPLHFLLEHGQFYPVAARPEWLPVGAPQMCYGNSLLLADWFGLQYVEGMGLLSLNNEPPLALRHAWVTDATGAAWEVTHTQPWLAYFGMAFSIERADDATWYGDACVLDDWRRDQPLLWQRWEGERPLKRYTPSLPLRQCRKRKREGYTVFGVR